MGSTDDRGDLTRRDWIKVMGAAGAASVVSGALPATGAVAGTAMPNVTRAVPQYAGHLSMWDDGPGAVTVSSYIHGYNETAITDEQL